MTVDMKKSLLEQAENLVGLAKKRIELSSVELTFDENEN